MHVVELSDEGSGMGGFILLTVSIAMVSAIAIGGVVNLRRRNMN